MKIKITEFGARHFDHKFGGTKILNKTIDEVEKEINDEITDLNFNIDRKPNNLQYKVIEGYAPFCKLVSIKNFTNAKVGSMPITVENYQYLRSGYSARRENELPVFSRWLELPIGKPRAEYLMFVLYSKEQIDKEGNLEELKERHYSDYETEKEKYELVGELDCFSDNFEDWCDENNYSGSFSFDADWGIVAILGQSHSNSVPMKPETMMRNALGIEEGGSGVKLDRNAYNSSCEFWDKHATVK